MAGRFTGSNLQVSGIEPQSCQVAVEWSFREWRSLSSRVAEEVFREEKRAEE